MDSFGVSLFITVSIFWFIVSLKSLLFWLYLWQLKEYHIGRFLDHFRTHQGRKLIFHPLLGAKIVLVILFLASSYFFLLFPLILFLFYFSLTLFLLRSFFAKRIKKPVFTKKTAVLISAVLVIVIACPIVLFWLVKDIFWASFGLLVFDIFIPKITSLIVLALQPLTVLLRSKTLKGAAEKIKKNRKLITIGITGSYGKSSTKEILSAILSEEFKVLKTKKNQNSEMGISQCILNELKPEHQIFVCEMGAYNKGGIKLLADIAKPKIGILTGINEQHMATFGSQEKIIKTKYELIENLPANGLAIFNGDNKHCLELFKKTKKPPKLLYSEQKKTDNQEADIWAENIEVKKDSLFFVAKTKKGETLQVKVDLVGKQNILNILGAVLCARELGMEMENIKKGIARIKREQGATKLQEGKGGINILDSSYSSNPQGVMANLEHLRLWKGKKIIVMPCLIELGKASKEIHRKIGEKIGEICDLAIITTKDRFREIQEGAGDSKEKILFIENPYKVFEKIKSFCKKDDVVLLEGRVSNKLIDLLI